MSKINFKNCHFLLVDDSRLIRAAYKKILSQTAAQYDLASTGKECIDLLNANKNYDLIILDYTLPDLNGIELLQHIRKTHTLTELPVIIVTTKDDIQIATACFSYGANDYLKKPFNEQELLHRISIQIEMKKLLIESNIFERHQIANAIIASYNHELNNPLSIALNAAKRIKLIDGDEASLRKMDMLLTSLVRIKDLILKISQATKFELTTYAEESKMLDLESDH